MTSATVVGAGLAGLTAALRLQQAGWQVTVVESESHIGGRTRTVSKSGYRFDTGALAFGTVYGEMMSLIEELGLRAQLVESSTTMAILRGGRIHEIDTGRKVTAITSRVISLRSKVKLLNLVVDLAKARRSITIGDLAGSADLDDETIGTYARRRLNPELLEYLIEPSVRLVNLSRAGEVSKLEVFNSFCGLLDTKLVHLLGGIEVLTEAIAKQLAVQRDTAVVDVVLQNNSVVVRARGHDGAVNEFESDYCVIATRLPEAVDIFPDAKVDLAPLADCIQYSRGLCIHLGYAAPAGTSALSIIFPPSEEDSIAVIFLEHNKAPDRAPAGKSMLTVVLDGAQAEASWDSDDDLLVERFATRVERILPNLRGALEMTHVTRWPIGLTNPREGIYRAMRAVNDRRNPSDRVQLIGDYRSVAGQNSAISWANRIAADLIAHAAGGTSSSPVDPS